MQNYNNKIDIWSMGVVLYIMLSGKVPFPGRSEPEIITNVMKGDYHFKHPAFANVSEECKDLIRLCLVKDYKRRINAQEGLSHPWFAKFTGDPINQGTIGQQAPTDVINGIAEIMKEGSNPKQEVYNYLSQQVNVGNYEGLTKDLFDADGDGSGMMDSEQFVRCLSKNHMKLGPAQLNKLLEKLSDSGQAELKVDYRNFLKYSYLAHLFINHVLLATNMRDTDQSGSGQITVAQLDNILQNNQFGLPKEALDKVFQEMLQCSLE